MERISIALPDEQREWINRVALDIDGSRSDVIQRAVAAYRRQRADNDEDDTDTEPTPEAEVKAKDAIETDGTGGSVENGPSRAELLERVEELEKALQDQPVSQSQDSTTDDGTVDEYDDENIGWR